MNGAAPASSPDRIPFATLATMTSAAPPTAAVTELPPAGSRVFTGTRPTGPWHIGQMWAVLSNMVKLQEAYDCYFCLVDYHALTTAWAHPERIQGNIREIALDWMAGGIDPLRSTLFVQSHVPEVIEFAGLLNMITPVAWLERNPTYRETLEQNKAAEANAGLFTYPVLQTADICLYKGELVPIGKDQATHLHLAQDIAKTFLRIFKRPIFPVPGYLFAEVPLIPGLDNRKMSKSYGNAIDMRESAESTQEKVMRMYTDPQKQRKGDPGHPEHCPVFTFHGIVSPTETVSEVRGGCTSGALGCVDCKRLMGSNLVTHLAPMRERRATLAGHPKQVDELLGYGAEKARKVARETLREVREVMGLERGFYITDGGLALPPALQFNPQDPEFQGGYHQFFVQVAEGDRASVRAYLLDQAESLQFKFHGFEEVQGGEVIILVSGNPRLAIPGVPLQPLGAGYELHVTVPLEQVKRLHIDQLSQAIIDTNPKKIYATGVRPIAGGVVFRVFGKSLSPSDQRHLVQRLATLMEIPAEGLELVPNDAVNAGPRSVSVPVRVRGTITPGE